MLYFRKHRFSMVSSSTPASSKSRLVTILGFITMVLIWGSFPVATKIGVDNAPPLLFCSVRFLLAFVIMAAIVRVQGKRLWITGKQHRQIFLVSLCMVGIPSSIFFASTPYAPVSVLTLMWATTPIFTALFNVRGTGEIHGWRLPCSLLIGSIGIMVVLLGHLPFWPGSTFTLGSSGLALVGELAVLGSSRVYGPGMLLSTRRSPDIPVMPLTARPILFRDLVFSSLSLP